jgi:hypothetical protein
VVLGFSLEDDDDLPDRLRTVQQPRSRFGRRDGEQHASDRVRRAAKLRRGRSPAADLYKLSPQNVYEYFAEIRAADRHHAFNIHLLLADRVPIIKRLAEKFPNIMA